MEDEEPKEGDGDHSHDHSTDDDDDDGVDLGAWFGNEKHYQIDYKS